MTTTYRAESGLWVCLDDGHTVDVSTPAAVVPLWGIAYGSNTPPTPLETTAGRSVGVHRIYANSGGATDVTNTINAATAAITAGRIPWVSFPWPSGVTSATAKTGAADTWAMDIVTRLGSAGGPVLCTFNHEGNLSTKDSTLGLDYALAHDHVYQATTGISANVKIGPIVTGYEVVYNTSTPHLADMWPGTMHEDFLGLDAYNYYGTARSGGWWYIGPTYWTPIANFAASKGVDWAVGEFGLSATGAAYNRSITGGSADGMTGGQVSWIAEAWSTAKSLSANTAPCLSVCWFDTYFNSTTNTTVGSIGNQVGQPAWILDDQGGHFADHGTPSKLDAWLAVLAESPTAWADWPTGA